MLIDTHAHLWFDDFANDLDQVVEKAKTAGVEKMIVPGTDLESSKKAIEIARRYPGVVYAAVGIHPEEVVSLNIDKLRTLITDEQPVVAIGEIGTDASTAELRACMEEQKNLFREQCELALEHDLPVIIHTRESFKETWEVLSSLPQMPRGQFHCFSNDEESLKTVIEHGFYVSFCGNISWSKRVAKLVQNVPSDRLLLETDSPFMVPRDKTGNPIRQSERNEPANVAYLAKLIAELRGVETEEIAQATTTNALRLFRL